MISSTSSSSHGERGHFENQYYKRSLILGVGIHLLLLLVRMDLEPSKLVQEELKKKEESKAIKISLVQFHHKTKPRAVKVQQSPIAVQEKITKPLPPKVEAGTEKVVKNSKALGIPNRPIVKNVQKGDPYSKIKKPYKIGTEFRKVPRTTIGSGTTALKKVASADTGGSGDTYKGGSFIKEIGRLKSSDLKVGRLKTARSFADDGGSGGGQGGGIGNGSGGLAGNGSITGSSQGTLKMARVANNIGSLSGSDKGALEASGGMDGLAHRGHVLIAGVPGKDLVLGSLDPSIISKILRDHIPQFRYCYQNALDKNGNQGSFEGVMNFNFLINREGRVENVNLTSKDELPGAVKSCVTNIVLGLRFPQPRGGGVVQINQPINFYSKVKVI